MTAKRIYSTREICDITGATPRMMQYWDEMSIIPAGRVGRDRAYNYKDIHLVKRMMAMQSVSLRGKFAEPFLREDWNRVATVSFGKPAIIKGTLVVPVR